MRHGEPGRSNSSCTGQQTGIVEKLKSISILAWLNLLFILMIVAILLFPDILPQSKREREWNALLKAASAPLLPVEKVERITPQLTFAQILYILPESEAVLNKHGLLCGTCSIARYETIEMATRVYNFDIETLVRELNDLLRKRKEGG